MNYIVVALEDLLNKLGENEENLIKYLKRFSCQNEKDLEAFLHFKAINYEKANIGKTFLILDEDKLNDDEFIVLAFFTIGHTSVDISNISSGRRRKILGSIPGRDKLTSISAFLIGQLGRDDACSKEKLTGETILNEAFTIINKAVKIIGGNLLILECREHMFSKFYEKYGFKKLSDELDSNSLYTLYKRIK